ncbi:hypothetical protein [Bradyrhizobium sp. SBR1B]|uniref:hypothetical protein n=1 Tax=Bradyrhizobium sp. SBR1B TaxID=2663836 RepID=UPI0017DA840A|nr:hypothetical protein [Bradyrhizobium sp. SBR1B]MBB4383225.1 hypothetical protein [Bradyrhizobium sp. SBR1B]
MKGSAICRITTHISPAIKGTSLEIFAPSLRSLPDNSMLVMATLPIIDWNDCLLRDLRGLAKQQFVGVYAAMVMIDPFACWEDIADLLKDVGICGVINFPPASILEQPSAGIPANSGQEIELRRMEWFASLGFRMLFATARRSEMTAAETRLGSQLEGIVNMPEESFSLKVCDEMKLVSLGLQKSSIPTFSLCAAPGSKRIRRKE